MANDLIDRALKMMQMAGYTVVEHNPDHANPIIGWMASAKEFLPLNYKRNAVIDAVIRTVKESS